MRKFLALALAASVALSAASAADARDGCGPGGHRGPYGHCRPNRGPDRGEVVRVAPGGLVVDRFYAGRGYWDGTRYWQHRTRWHGGWRYR